MMNTEFTVILIVTSHRRPTFVLTVSLWLIITHLD